MDQITLLETIQEFCKNNESRDRADLYDFLNEELGIDLDASSYDGAEFADDPGSRKWEAEYILNILYDEDEYYDDIEYYDKYEF